MSRFFLPLFSSFFLCDFIAVEEFLFSLAIFFHFQEARKNKSPSRFVRGRYQPGFSQSTKSVYACIDFLQAACLQGKFASSDLNNQSPVNMEEIILIVGAVARLMNFFFLCISSLASAGWTLLFVISLILRKPLIKKFWVYLKDLEKRAHEAKENKETMKNIFYHGFVYFCYSPIAFVLLLWLLAYGERA